MKNALGLYLFLFVFLSLLIHFKEFINYPIKHTLNLANAGAYGFGSLHPIIFTTLVFVVVLLLQLILKFLKKVIR